MKQTVILKNKLFLYLTEFFAGMSVMAVELGASRLLAPYFSSSQIVWTIIIGTIMIAMALGNIYGGRSADKSPNPDRLYTRILIAAIWIALIPVVGKYIVLGISALLIFTVSNHFLIIAAFAACMVIFVFPLFLLGTVTPSLVKYAVDSLDDNGKTVGTLGAFNTIGSIIGTFVPTFVTIPAVGTSITFLIFSGILLVLAIVYFVNVRAGKKKVIVSVVIFALCCGLGYSDSFAFWEKNLTYEGESVYNYLQVSEDDTSVRLSTNVLFGVQIDEKITQLSRKYFSLSEDVPVTTYDGRAYLNAMDKKYDVIMVDAYQDITIPFQMSSVEFFTLVKDHLNEDGVMVVNMNMRGSGDGNINQYLSDTIGQVFDAEYPVDVANTTNRELFASNNPSIMENLQANTKQITNADLRNMMETVYADSTPYGKGDYILTDDKAPVELLGMQVIDQLIEEEVAYYKGIYERDGIQGVLNSL